MTAPINPGIMRAAQEARYGSSSATLRMYAELDGQFVTPSAATVSILKPGQTTATISGASVTISGNLMTYALDASNTGTWPLLESCRAEWSYTANGVVQDPRAMLFDVVRTPLLHHMPCTVDELRGAAPAIDQMLSNSAQLTSAASYITTAMIEIVEWVRAQGRRVSLVSDPTVFHSLLRYRALLLMARGARRSSGDLWDKLIKEFEEEAERAKARLVLRYDEGDSRNATPVHAMQQPRMFFGPSPDAGQFLDWQSWGRR